MLLGFAGSRYDTKDYAVAQAKLCHGRISWRKGALPTSSGNWS
jgi:hypothetical protein